MAEGDFGFGRRPEVGTADYLKWQQAHRDEFYAYLGTPGYSTKEEMAAAKARHSVPLNTNPRQPRGQAVPGGVLVTGLEDIVDALEGHFLAGAVWTSAVRAQLSAQLLAGIVFKTPIHSGAARANWQIGFGEIPSGVLYPPPQEVGGTRLRARHEATQQLEAFKLKYANQPDAHKTEEYHQDQQTITEMIKFAEGPQATSSPLYPWYDNLRTNLESIFSVEALHKPHYIANNLSYITALEDGWSQQAPHGMVRTTINEVARMVDSIANSLWNISLERPDLNFNNMMANALSAYRYADIIPGAVRTARSHGFRGDAIFTGTRKLRYGPPGPRSSIPIRDTSYRISLGRDYTGYIVRGSDRGYRGPKSKYRGGPFNTGTGSSRNYIKAGKRKGRGGRGRRNTD